MKIVSYNIRFGLGTDHQINLERIADTVRDADIIGLQEVERHWKHSGMTDQPDILGGHLKEFHWVYFPAFDMDASEHGDDGSVHNRRRQFGPMVLSRWPIRSSRLIVLHKLGTVDNLNMDTGAIECVIDTPSGSLRVYSVHLGAVSSRERHMQIDRLLEFHRNAQVNGAAWTGNAALIDAVEDRHMDDLEWDNGEPPPTMPHETIVIGDFNSVPESDEYKRMVSELDPCFGRVGHVDGFIDSWTALDEQPNDRITWLPDPPERAPGHGLTLDYCFLSPDLGHKVERAWIDSAAIGSPSLFTGFIAIPGNVYFTVSVEVCAQVHNGSARLGGISRVPRDISI